MQLGLLNTSIMTGIDELEVAVYEIRKISLEDARTLVRKYLDVGGLDSAIGHESTAQVMSALLGVEVAVNRQTFNQQEGQTCLVFKLNGRAPEGRILSVAEIESIGYKFYALIRLDHSYDGTF
jgi:Domain of unknown function (DUF1874)